MKRVLAIILSILFIALPICACKSDKVEKEQNVSLESVGLTKDIITKKYDFKAKDNNIYFKILSDLRVYEPGAPIDYVIYVDESETFAYTVEVSFSNKKFGVDDKKTHIIDAGDGAKARKETFIGTKNGIYEFKFSVNNDVGTSVYSGRKNIGIMPKAKKVASSDFYFGVQTYYQHLLDWGSTGFDNMSVKESYDLTWDYVDYMGANLVRDGSTWSTQQLTQSSAVNFANNDKIAKDAKDRGVVFNWFLGGQPDWAVDPTFANADKKWNKPPKPELWDAYISEVANHYKDDDNIIFEVVNECNWFDFLEATPERYLQMLDTVVEKVKAVNPDARITPGGMVTPNGSYTEKVESETYYKRFGELLKEDKIMMVPYHNHWAFQQFINEMKPVRDKFLANDIDKKFGFLNESGLESSGPEQGYEVLKKALWTYGNNHSGFVMFAFRATPGAGATSLPSWGSITERNEPKELYIAYANFISKMDGAKLVKVYANDIYNAYLYEKDNKHFLVHFRGDSAPDAAIDLGTENYTVTDYLGNSEVKETALKLGVKPVYVQFDQKINPDDISLKVNIVWEDKIDFGW